MAPLAWGGFVLTLVTMLVLLVLLGWPLSAWLARVYTAETDWRGERVVYRLLGVDPRAGQRWPAYFRGVLAFSVLGVLLLYGLQRLQAFLPYAEGMKAVPEGLAFNTAVSFVTNTNWQSYTPEQTLGYTVQLAGLAVQNFASAAVGIAVAIAVVRGLASRGAATIGNVWVDLTRSVVRVLLPLSIVAAVVLLATGVIQNFDSATTAHTLAGAAQAIPGGPVASQEAIKELGTNGGGFFNANSAHPFENPSGFSNLFEIVLLLLIPFALPRTYGLMVGDRRQGRAVLATMVVLYAACLAAMVAFQAGGGGTATHAAGAATEGTEDRFGILSSSIFSTSTTLTSTGAIDQAHDSLTPLGGMMALVDMMLGEVAPGGVGSGLYGLLVVAVVAVFLAGLMIGRTPSLLGKPVGRREITLASLYLLTTPAVVLAGLGLSFAIPAVSADIAKTSVLNTGPHGFSEVLYAFTSAGNNNGSAFAGLTANTPWLNAALAACMWFGRFLPIVFVLALAGSFAAESPIARPSRRLRGAPEPAPGAHPRPAGDGTLPTHRPLFVLLLLGTVVVVSALTYLPVLALGPLAEGL